MLFDVEGIVGLLLIGFWIYCVLDVIATDEALMRGLPKQVWLFLVLLFPDIGGVAWLLLGRARAGGVATG